MRLSWTLDIDGYWPRMEKALSSVSHSLRTVFAGSLRTTCTKDNVGSHENQKGSLGFNVYRVFIRKWYAPRELVHRMEHSVEFTLYIMAPFCVTLRAKDQ